MFIINIYMRVYAYTRTQNFNKKAYIAIISNLNEIN